MGAGGNEWLWMSSADSERKWVSKHPNVAVCMQRTVPGIIRVMKQVFLFPETSVTRWW